MAATAGPPPAVNFPTPAVSLKPTEPLRVEAICIGLLEDKDAGCGHVSPDTSKILQMRLTYRHEIGKFSWIITRVLKTGRRNQKRKSE